MNPVDFGSSAFWSLLAAGAVSGAASLWLFRRWSDQARLSAASRRVLAHLMEFRLFADEPALIVRAQWDLLKANAALLRTILVPSLLLTIPFAVVLVIASAFFDRGPLRAGEAAVVTIQCAGVIHDVRLEAPPGIAVEAPPVRVSSERQISWRVRPVHAVAGRLQFRWDGQTVEKSISAMPGLQWLSEQRSGSVLGYVAHPREQPFRSAAIDWIRIQYPSATVLGFPWPLWFSCGAFAGALAANIGVLRI